MATEGALSAIPGLSASANLAAKQFYIVKISGVRTVDITAAITDKILGVLQDTPGSGVAANVADRGKTKVIAGGTITAGDKVSTTNAGKAVTITMGTDTTQYLLGTALTSGVDGDLIEVELQIGPRCV